MTIPARYTLTEAHFRIAELEAERDRCDAGWREELDKRVLAEAEVARLVEAREELAVHATAHWNKLVAADARVTELEAAMVSWRLSLAAQAPNWAWNWAWIVSEIDAALAAPTKEDTDE